MSGIDTSRGINSVASTIAALEANGVQTITTNTGAHVTGLEAAAYEFGAILASYPADAPPLTRNAAVFQVTDANGNTSMVSLNDLADDIKRQTGYDPLVEFSSGVGATNQGYSVADITYVLHQLESRYSSMSFERLVVAQGNADLQVSGDITNTEQAAIAQLGASLGSTIPVSISNVVANTPGGLDPNADVFVTPNAQSQVLALQANVANLNQDISANLDIIQSAENDIANALAIIQAVQSNDYSSVSNQLVSDQLALQNANANLSAIQGAGSSSMATFATNLVAGLEAAVQFSGIANTGDGRLVLAGALFTGDVTPGYGQDSGIYKLMNYPQLSAQYGYDGLSPDAVLSSITSIATKVQDAFGPEFTAALQSSPDGSVDPSLQIFKAPDGTLHSFAEVLSQIRASLPQGFLQGFQSWQGSFNISNWLAGAFGGGVPASFTTQNVSSIKTALSGPSYSDPSAIFNDSNNGVKLYLSSYAYLPYGSGVITNSWGGNNPPGFDFAGLMSICGFDKTKASDVTSFNTMLDQVMPGASKKLFWTANDILALENGCARYSVSAAQSVVSQAQARLRLDSQAAISAARDTISRAQASISAAQAKITQDQSSITAAITNAMSSGALGTSNLQAQIRNLQTGISQDQTSIATAQTSLNELINAYAANPGVALTTDQQTQIASLRQQISNAKLDLQSKLQNISGLQNQLIAAVAPHGSFSDMLSEIQASTGIDLRQVINDLIGNGPITPYALNQIYSYINQTQPASAPKLTLIPDEQLMQSAVSQLQSLIQQPGLQAALDSGQAVSTDNPIFNIPGQQTQVSFNRAIDLIQRTTGVNLQSVINTLNLGQMLNRAGIDNLSAYLNSPLAQGRSIAPPSVTINGQTISGQLAAEYNLAAQMSGIDLGSVLQCGVPISIDSPVFYCPDATGNISLNSFKQLLQNAKLSGYDFSGLLATGQTSFNLGDVTAMISRLNADQTDASFRVDPAGLVNQVLSQAVYIASNVSLAPGSGVAQGVIREMQALGFANPTQIFGQAMLARYLSGFEGQPIAINGGKILIDAPNMVDLANGQPESLQLFLAYAADAGIDFSQVIPPGSTTITSDQLNAIFEQLNVANSGTCLVINNPFSHLKNQPAPGYINFVSVAPTPDSDLVTQLSSSFSVLGFGNTPPLAVQAPSAPITASKSLLQYNLPDLVMGGLIDVSLALNQLVPSDFDANGNLLLDRAVFNVPSISDRPVSLGQIFATNNRNTGVDFKTVLSGLVTTDPNSGAELINSNNLSSLIQLINQSLPQGTLKAESLNGILTTNVINPISPLANAIASASARMTNGGLAVLPSSSITQNLQNYRNYLAGQNLPFLKQYMGFGAQVGSFLGVGGLFSQIDPTYTGKANPTDADLTRFEESDFIQDLERNYGLQSSQFSQGGLSDGSANPNLSNASRTDYGTNTTWWDHIAEAINRKISATANPNTQAVAALLGVNLFNHSQVSGSLAASLGITIPANPTAADASSIYTQLKNQLSAVAPNFSWPSDVTQLTPDTLASLNSLAQQTLNTATSGVNGIRNSISRGSSSMDIDEVAKTLQNLRIENLDDAIAEGTASAQTTAAYNQNVNFQGASILSAAELNKQLESGDLYVSSTGQFFLNRQPTNARDASVAAMVIGGNKLNDKLNDLMNKVNLNNTKIQMASYLSAATSVADLKNRIAEQKQQYGFADVLSEITGGSITDDSITDSTDISAAGTFQSTLKTAINNATRNQDLDTQSLQQLTSQIQALNTAMTQLIQAFEQSLKGLAQNLR